MTSRRSAEFGKGALDGVAAPEAANNSASTGAMLPMMTLGIPGSPTTAVLLAGMVIWGLQPGPLLFTDQPEFVWPLIGSFYISNIIAVLVNLAFNISTSLAASNKKLSAFFLILLRSQFSYTGSFLE